MLVYQSVILQWWSQLVPQCVFFGVGWNLGSRGNCFATCWQCATFVGLIFVALLLGRWVFSSGEGCFLCKPFADMFPRFLQGPPTFPYRLQTFLGCGLHPWCHAFNGCLLLTFESRDWRPVQDHAHSSGFASTAFWRALCREPPRRSDLFRWYVLATWTCLAKLAKLQTPVLYRHWMAFF